MLCCAMLRYVMPCHATLCHAMPCHAVLCYAMSCHAVPCAGTSLTYAEWAPLAPLTDSGLIRACAYFLTTQDFRLLACDILKQLSHRRQEKVRRPLALFPRYKNAAASASTLIVSVMMCNDNHTSMQQVDKHCTLAVHLQACGEGHYFCRDLDPEHIGFHVHCQHLFDPACTSHMSHKPSLHLPYALSASVGTEVHNLYSSWHAFRK